MAGSADLLQRCFAGLETRGDVLWVNPHWPSRLGELAFAVEYRGLSLDLRVSGREVRVGWGDRVRDLAPGEAVHFPRPGSPAPGRGVRPAGTPRTAPVR